DASAHVGSAAARRARADRGQRADAAARRTAPRRVADGAVDEARRARLDRTAAVVTTVRLGALAVAAVAVTAALALGGDGRGHDAFAVVPLVSDGGVPAHAHDRSLVNAWGLASEPGGAWWTANEANDS